MSVLFSELLIPGWADGEAGKIGLGAVTSLTNDAESLDLPCHTSDPELFFSDELLSIATAKRLCGECPKKAACLAGAISRAEPGGIWGGELFDDGRVVAAKRTVGRPRLIQISEESLAS